VYISERFDGRDGLVAGMGDMKTELRTLTDTIGRLTTAVEQERP
jgi:hypothetical protein